MERKEQSNRDLVARLAADGYRVDYDAIREATPDGNVNRALIAKALLAGGYVPSVKAAFDTIQYSIAYALIPVFIGFGIKGEWFPHCSRNSEDCCRSYLG